MVFCGFTGGRREKRSLNYLSVKNPSTEKREKKRREEKNREKERTKKERRDNESEFLNIFCITLVFSSRQFYSYYNYQHLHH